MSDDLNDAVKTNEDEDIEPTEEITPTPDVETNVLSGGFYSDDLSAEVIAENGGDPESLKEDEDIPVTSGELSIGDLDDGEEPEDPSESQDEENVAGGEDNVVSED